MSMRERSRYTPTFCHDVWVVEDGILEQTAELLPGGLLDERHVESSQQRDTLSAGWSERG